MEIHEYLDEVLVKDTSQGFQNIFYSTRVLILALHALSAVVYL